MLVPFHQREGVYVLDAESVSKNELIYTPNVHRAYVGSGAWWELYLTNTGEECPSGIVHILRSHSDSATTDVDSGVSVYTRTASSALALNALEGCSPRFNIGAPATPPAETLPAETVWSGTLHFIGSETRVTVPFGSSSAPLGSNPVYEKVNRIMDTSYIDFGNSLYIHGWTDGIKADKYIVCTDVNTTQGDATVTNTLYPLPDINTWGKSFVGIAN